MAARIARTRYVPNNAVEVKDEQSDAVVYLYTNGNGKPTVIAYHGKSTKSDFHYHYPTEEKRAKKVEEFFESRRARAKVMADRKAERNKPHTFEVGHVLVTSWGYDQTNVDFYQVTKVLGPKMVEIRAIRSVQTKGDGWTGSVVPDIDNFKGEPMRKKVAEGYIRLASFSHARLWDGRPCHFTAYA